MSPAVDPEDVAKPDRKLREGCGKVELRETVLLRGLIALLFVQRHRRIVAGQLAEIRPERPGDVLRDLAVDIELGHVAGLGIA